MRYFVSIEQFQFIHTLLTETIFKIDINYKFLVCDLARVLGKIHSLSRSDGSIISIMTHHLQHIVGKKVFQDGW